MLSKKSEKTLKQLREKAEASYFDKKRMPSIKNINELLNELGVETSFYESLNVVEYRSGQNVYVNDRHDGKAGYKLTFRRDGKYFNLDTSDSYYSWNSGMYARKLVELIDTLI